MRRRTDARQHGERLRRCCQIRGYREKIAARAAEEVRRARVTTNNLGLGLAIAAHIVREHDGRISVTSPGRGKGATVVARFPAISQP